MATRWLGLLGMVGKDGDYRSILSGCILSIPFTRVYLKEKMEGMVASHPAVQFSLYVDGAVHLCVGKSAAAVGMALACAACQLVGESLKYLDLRSRCVKTKSAR